MSVTRDGADPVTTLWSHGANPGTHRRYSENAPRHLVPQTWVQVKRILTRWGRDFATVSESLILPILFLLTLDIVLGQQISRITGHSALYGSVPMITLGAAINGASVGAIGLIRECTNGFLSRLWVLPVHRASGLLSRIAAEGVRILLTTVGVLIVGMILGFRFEQGPLASLVWLFVPVIFGVACATLIMAVALFWGRMLIVQAVTVVHALAIFFSTGFIPLASYPHWIQPAVEHQPMTYAIEAMRGLSLGGPVRSPMVGMLLWAAGIIALSVVPLVIAYRKASTH